MTLFWLVEDRESGKLSGPIAEVEASSKNLRRLPECNIQFQMMLFESLKSFIFLKRNYLCCSAAGRCFS